MDFSANTVRLMCEMCLHAQVLKSIAFVVTLEIHSANFKHH